MTLGIIVLAHRNPGQLATLLSALRHPRVRIYLHIDAGVDEAPFRAALSGEDTGAVDLLPRFRSRWGGIEVVDATLGGISRALADGCAHVVLISGQDFPLRPAEGLVSFFAEAPGRSYLSYFPLPDSRWRHDGRLRTDFYTYTILGRRETCIPWGEPTTLNWKGRTLNSLLRLRSAFRPPRRFPSFLNPFGGAQWWNLSRDAATYLLDFVERHPEYRAYHEHTLLPDEIFFQSVLLGTSFADSNEIVNDHLRFMIWSEGASHPETLTMSHLPELLESDRLFARKVDATTHPDVIHALQVAVGSEGESS